MSTMVYMYPSSSESVVCMVRLCGRFYIRKYSRLPAVIPSRRCVEQ